MLTAKAHFNLDEFFTIYYENTLQLFNNVDTEAY